MLYKLGLLTTMTALNFYSGTLIAGPNLNSNIPQCRSLFNLDAPLAAESDEWKRVSVRDPSKKLLNVTFLTRLHSSVYDVFEPWFLGKVRNETFKDMLQKQHIVATTDESGQAYYTGASFASDDLTQPGAYVFELKELYGEKVNVNKQRMGLDPVRYEEHLSPELSKRLTAKLRKMSKEERKGARDFRYALKLPRLGFDVLVGCEVYIDDKEIIHGWPIFKDVPKVLQTMDEIMREIQSIPRGEANDVVISKLTEYIYLGATAGHPFRRANFSLFMSHVNWVLRYHGLKGISHGSLDFISMYFQYEEFSEEFLKAIRAANPGL